MRSPLGRKIAVYPCGMYVIPMWYPCGVHVIPMWCACDTHVSYPLCEHFIWIKYLGITSQTWRPTPWYPTRWPAFSTTAITRNTMTFSECRCRDDTSTRSSQDSLIRAVMTICKKQGVINKMSVPMLSLGILWRFLNAEAEMTPAPGVARTRSLGLKKK